MTGNILNRLGILFAMILCGAGAYAQQPEMKGDSSILESFYKAAPKDRFSLQVEAEAYSIESCKKISGYAVEGGVSLVPVNGRPRFRSEISAIDGTRVEVPASFWWGATFGRMRGYSLDRVKYPPEAELHTKLLSVLQFVIPGRPTTVPRLDASGRWSWEGYLGGESDSGAGYAFEVETASGGQNVVTARFPRGEWPDRRSGIYSEARMVYDGFVFLKCTANWLIYRDGILLSESRLSAESKGR